MGGGERPDQDDAVEHVTSRGRDMFMDPEQEFRARKVSLERGVLEAKKNRVGKDQAERLRDILARHVNAFRGALRGNILRRGCNPWPSSSSQWLRLLKRDPDGTTLPSPRGRPDA